MSKLCKSIITIRQEWKDGGYTLLLLRIEWFIIDKGESRFWQTQKTLKRLLHTSGECPTVFQVEPLWNFFVLKAQQQIISVAVIYVYPYFVKEPSVNHTTDVYRRRAPPPPPFYFSHAHTIRALVVL